jgi:hypothetical protein
MVVAIPVSAAIAVPSSFVRHENRYWTWYAPKHWVASFGKQGIDITSPTGTKLAGTAHATNGPCPGSTAQYFRQIRNALRQGGNLYPKPLRSARYTSVGRVRNLGGDEFQHATFRGTRTSGAGVRGEVNLRLLRGGGACGLIGDVSSAPARGFARSIRLLRQIQRAIFYHLR